MRLYSRKELLLYIAVSVLAVSLGLTLLENMRESSRIRLEEKESLSSAEGGGLPVFNPPEGDYTAEEQINISIYERLNEAVVNINTDSHVI